jgi:hypothetical protein
MKAISGMYVINFTDIADKGKLESPNTKTNLGDNK